MAAISPALQTHRSPQKCLLALLALLALSKTPPLLTQRKLRHRSTRTLNPLADGAAAPRKPNFHHLHHTHHRAQRSVRPSARLPSSASHFRSIRIIRVPDCFTRPAIRAPAACVAPHKFAIFRLFWNLSAPPFTKILHFYFATAFIFTNFAADLFITHI